MKISYKLSTKLMRTTKRNSGQNPPSKCPQTIQQLKFSLEKTWFRLNAKNLIQVKALSAFKLHVY